MRPDHVYQVLIHNYHAQLFYSLQRAYEYACNLMYEYQGNCNIYCENFAVVEKALDEGYVVRVWHHEDEPANQATIVKHRMED
jgi:hypothetical protein